MDVRSLNKDSSRSTNTQNECEIFHELRRHEPKTIGCLTYELRSMYLSEVTRSAEKGFGYSESETDVNSGLGRGTKTHSLPNLETLQLSVPGSDSGAESTFKLSTKFIVRRSKVGVPGRMLPAIEGQWLLIFTFERIHFLCCLLTT